MKGRILNGLARPGEHATFHIVCISGLATGTAMVATASDMGALAPLIIACGFYLAFFALLAEVLLGVRCLVAGLAHRFLLRAPSEDAAQPQSLIRRPRLQAPVR